MHQFQEEDVLFSPQSQKALAIFFFIVISLQTSSMSLSSGASSSSLCRTRQVQVRLFFSFSSLLSRHSLCSSSRERSSKSSVEESRLQTHHFCTALHWSLLMMTAYLDARNTREQNGAMLVLYKEEDGRS